MPDAAAHEAERRKGHRRLLAVEGAMFAALRRRRREVIAGRSAFGAAFVAGALLPALAAEVQRHGETAREESRASTMAELAILATQLRPMARRRPPRDREAEALAAVRGEVERWHREYSRAREPYALVRGRQAAPLSRPLLRAHGAPYRTPGLVVDHEADAAAMRAAAGNQEVLRRIAATEASKAWNEDRQQAAVQVADHARQLGLVVFEVWDATLDGVTCGPCLSMHGHRTKPGEAWRNGLRPGFHPNCRCTSYIVVK